MKKNLKMVIILILLILLYTCICAVSYAQTVSSDISESVFRLHVIANSDSKEDQDLKYIVRDNLLKYMNSICSNCTSKEEAIKLVNENKDKFSFITSPIVVVGNQTRQKFQIKEPLLYNETFKLDKDKTTTKWDSI